MPLTSSATERPEGAEREAPASSLTTSFISMDTNSPEFEVMLFRSVIQHRPVGAGRHFSMAGMLSTLSQELGPKFDGITAKDIWKMLDKFYNLSELDALVRLALTATLSLGCLDLR